MERTLLNLFSVTVNAPPKQNGVIDELCMVCRYDSSWNFQAFKIPIILLLLKLSAHGFNNQKVKIGILIELQQYYVFEYGSYYVDLNIISGWEKFENI